VRRLAEAAYNIGCSQWFSQKARLAGRQEFRDLQFTVQTVLIVPCDLGRIVEMVHAKRKPWKVSPWWAGTFLFLLTCMVYLPGLRNGFVWDDDNLVVNSRLVRASDGLYRFWCTTEATDYWPLTSTAWWLEWRLWGNRPVGYHVVNVLLHAANATLIWIILRRLKVPRAWLAALLFAIHPVNVATAAWISEQKNTLSMLLFGAAILLYLRFDEAGRWRWYTLSLAAFVLSLLSKAAVVMLPVVLLLCLWRLHGRIRRQDVLRSAPFFMASLALGLVTVWFQYHRAMGGQAMRDNGLISHLAVAGCVPWFYAYKILLPAHLAVIYPKWDVAGGSWNACLPAVILAGGFALFWWKRKTWGGGPLVGFGYFVAMLFPVMGFFNQGFHRYSLVADHWQYYSSIGMIALVVAAGTTLCRRDGRRSRYMGMAASVMIAILLASITRARIAVYKNNETFWGDAVKKNPNAWLAYYNLGNARARVGDSRQAIQYYKKAVQLRPDYGDAHLNLGDALLREGDLTEAINQYEQTAQIEPDVADVHNNLGLALIRAGRVGEAIEHYERALQIDPNFAAARYNLGNAFLGGGRMKDAIAEYEEAVRLRPDDADAHNNLAFALGREDRIQEAIGHCEEALRIRPGFAEAHYNWGNALLQEGKSQEARAQFEEAVRLKPDFAEARDQLARVPAVP
jgi:protein O-mannosyl-transferase